MKPQTSKAEDIASQLDEGLLNATNVLADAANGENLVKVDGDRLIAEWSTDPTKENYEAIVNESVDRIAAVLGKQGFELKHTYGDFDKNEAHTAGGDTWTVVRKSN